MCPEVLGKGSRESSYHSEFLRETHLLPKKGCQDGVEEEGSHRFEGFNPDGLNAGYTTESLLILGRRDVDTRRAFR